MTLAKDAEITVTFKVKVNDDAAVEPIVNDAEVRDGENEFTTNEVTNPTPPQKTVYKSEEPTINIDGKKVEPGDNLSYAITYKNATGEEAVVTITDTIPEYTTFVVATDDGKYDPVTNTVTWTKTLAKDETITVMFQVTVNEDAATDPVKNEATVKEGENEYKTNETTNWIPTPPTKDVFKNGETEVSVDGQKVLAGDILTYEITYKNTTGEDADVTISDSIPQYTTYVDGSADHDGVYADGTITWTLKVAKDETVTVKFDVKVDDVNNGEKIVNGADVKAGENEYKTNEVTNWIPTVPVKEVFTGSSKTNIDGQQVQPGQELTYEITYTNTTGADAEVTITDTVPAYTEYVSADNDGVYSDGTITWTKTLKVNETVTVSFTVKVSADAAGQTVTNKAVVRDGENEYGTNEVTNSIPTPPTKDVFKSDKPGVSINGKEVKAHEQLIYEITYTNTTGKDADVTITDKVPQFTKFVAAGNGGTLVDDTVVWNLKVAKGKTVKVMFQVEVEEVDGEDAREIPNSADVLEGENKYTTNEVVNTVPGTPKTGDDTVRYIAMFGSSSAVLILCMILMIARKRKEEEEA